MAGAIPRQRPKVKTPSINTYGKQMQQCETKINKITSTLQPPLVAKSTEYKNDLIWKGFSPQELQFNWKRHMLRRRSSNRSLFARRKSSLLNLSEIPTPEFQKGQRISSNYDSSEFAPHSFQDKSRMTPRIFTSSPIKNSDTNLRQRVINRIIRDFQNEGQPESKTSPVRPAEGVQSSTHYHDYFIRALTTLAINDYTSSSSMQPTNEQKTSHNLYDRNIQILLDGPNLLEGTTPQHHPIRNYERKSNSAQSSFISSETSTRDDDGSSIGPDKRERIKWLRDYLKCSGYGEPAVITINNQETEETKKELIQLVRKVHRGLSKEKKERLRLKTHLDYEMCLMKGESFCEQHDQVYMRTASADMGDLDQQLLEEEMKDQLLHGMNFNSEPDDLNYNARQKRANRNKQRKQNFLDSNDDNKKNTPLGGNGEEADYRLLLGVRENDDLGTGDDMSGALRSPISRREIRGRVLEWVAGVENAMGLEWKEKMRVTYGHRISGRKLEENESEKVINEVMAVNADKSFDLEVLES